MRLHVIETGYLKLDGGAMFGIVPKTMWERLQQPDAKNRCTWAMRCLLVETAERRILIDTGIGDKQDEHFRAIFEPQGPYTLLDALRDKGFQPEDITDVFLTHLHFDHVGGAITRNADGQLRPTFPKAFYWTNQAHLDWALNPNPREKASFLEENIRPLVEAGVLRFIEVQEEDTAWLPGFRVRFVYGHTEAMMVPLIECNGQTIVYCADVMPSVHHIGLPYIMAYDLRPLLTLEEKTRILADAHTQNHWLFFEHDLSVPACTVAMDSRQRWVRGETITAERLEAL